MKQNSFFKITYLFILILTLLSNSSKAADYIEYNRIMSKIKVDLLNDRKESALADFENKIYNNYKFIFAKDIFMATQLAVVTQNKTLSEKYIEKCAIQGIPYIVIQNDKVIGPSKSETEWETFQQKFKELHNQYLQNINLKVKSTIDSLFKLDTHQTHKINKNSFFRNIFFYPKWRNVVNRNFKTITSIIKEYGYPGEQLIGLSHITEKDSISLSKIKIGVNYSLFQSKALSMIQHYYSPFISNKPDINDILQNSLKSGYLPATYYAIFNDFLAEFGHKRYNNNYYNEMKTGPKENLTAINKRREDIGLYSYEVRLELDKRRLNNERARKLVNDVYVPD